MPNPVDSAHFGRWSGCANELLKQRALGQPELPEFLLQHDISEEVSVAAQLCSLASAYDLDAEAGQGDSGAHDVSVARHSAGTLAEQARQLNSEAAGRLATDSLQNLKFIGSSTSPPANGKPARLIRVDASLTESAPLTEPPPANLRNPAIVDMDVVLEPKFPCETKGVTPFSSTLMTSQDA